MKSNKDNKIKPTCTLTQTQLKNMYIKDQNSLVWQFGILQGDFSPSIRLKKKAQRSCSPHLLPFLPYKSVMPVKNDILDWKRNHLPNTKKSKNKLPKHGGLGAVSCFFVFIWSKTSIKEWPSKLSSIFSPQMNHASLKDSLKPKSALSMSH